MHLSIIESKNAKSLYVIRSTYKNGRNSSERVEKLGSYAELLEKLNGQDPIVWAKSYIAKLNEKEKAGKRDVTITFSPAKHIEKNTQVLFNGGYLFLQYIYYALGLDFISKKISKKHKFTFDLNSILSNLLYARILFPGSKLETAQLVKKFLEPPSFDLQHVYRALGIIATESDLIQSELYKNSLLMTERNTHILYYDCTNYFFEIEQESGLRQYGMSKEHRPNPIVQMGLFMDGDGIPLAFNISKGNTNEQITLTPLEQKLLKDFELSKLIVCTDAGLASMANRKFNDKKKRAFITTQSIKKLKKPLQEWALSKTGWHKPGAEGTFDISILDTDEAMAEAYKNTIFYKERWISENELEQRLLVTYSLKYKNYQREIRHDQIDRATKLVQKNPKKIGKFNQNDYKRFVTKKSITPDGEIASKNLYNIDFDRIVKEEMFDGYYGICTNLEDDAQSIININHQRWEIEESFRIMKTEFRARPVYLSRDDRIFAHFTTCFLALTLYRFLEKTLENRFTCHKIIQGLRDLNFYKLKNEGYIPAYVSNDFTDLLHEKFQFQTDLQIVSTQEMKKIFKFTKSGKTLLKK
ncbi:MAG: IS1634 family transposase [Selenomonadaceae bacterium]